MSGRAVYETAFDSVVTTVHPDSDPEAEVLEHSRRLCTPLPSQRPSPASSRSSTGSERSGRRRKSPRSPALPLKKLFGPWSCGSAESVPDTPVDNNIPPPTTDDKSSKTFSPSVEFKKLDVADESAKNLNEPAKSSSSPLHNHNCGDEGVPRMQLNWDSRPQASTSTSEVFYGDDKLQNGHGILNKTLNCSTSWASRQDLMCSNENNLRANSAFENDRLKMDQSMPFQIPRTTREDMKRTKFEANTTTRNNLWLDFSRAPKRQRRHLFLDISKPGNEDEMEPTKYLLKQEWYHGSITRTDAEELLRYMKKGSFLVRCSEKLNRHYLLSLKSSRGVMHVKITQSADGKYVMKQQSQSFDSVPQLVQYFGAHVLHIHEMSVYLAHPVAQNLL